jgi:hypothetical protein
MESISSWFAILLLAILSYPRFVFEHTRRNHPGEFTQKTILPARKLAGSIGL